MLSGGKSGLRCTDWTTFWEKNMLLIILPLIQDHFIFKSTGECKCKLKLNLRVNSSNNRQFLRKSEVKSKTVECGISSFWLHFYKTYFFHLFPLRADQWPCNVFVSIVASLVYGLSIAVTSSLPSPHHVVYSQNKDNKYFQSICSEIFMRMQKSQIA